MKIRAQISEILFIVKPTFCPYLMEIHSYVDELRGVSMAWANSNHLYHLDDYAELQVTTREKKAKPALESVVEKIQQVRFVVVRSCQAKLIESCRTTSALANAMFYGLCIVSICAWKAHEYRECGGDLVLEGCSTAHRWLRNCAERCKNKQGSIRSRFEMFLSLLTPLALSSSKVGAVARTEA